MSQLTPESECLQYVDEHYTEHAKQVNYMHVSAVLRKISTLFRDGQVIQILFLTLPKQKVMVISTPQMSKHHQLKEEKINVKCNNITLERVSQWKLLGNTLKNIFILINIFRNY